MALSFSAFEGGSRCPHRWLGGGACASFCEPGLQLPRPAAPPPSPRAGLSPLPWPPPQPLAGCPPASPRDGSAPAGLGALGRSPWLVASGGLLGGTATSHALGLLVRWCFCPSRPAWCHVLFTCAPHPPIIELFPAPL